MHPFNSFALLVLSLPLLVHSKTVYIDSTCTSKPGWADYWKEMLENAKRAVERTNSASDSDFDNVFKRVFNTDKGSTEGQYAIDITKRIAEVTVDTDLKKSDIRIFCDEDARWKPRETFGWYDPINDMITSAPQPYCKVIGRALGKTYEARTAPSTDPADERFGQNPNRIVITLCEKAFTPHKNLPLMITDELKKKDLSDELVDYVGMIASHTINHELAHAVSHDDGAVKVFDLPNVSSAYGWKNVVAKQAAEAVKNADNYSYLCLWAALADMGYTLPRKNEPGLDDWEKRVREDDTLDGALYKYTDITKRSVVAVSFSA